MQKTVTDTDTYTKMAILLHLYYTNMVVKILEYIVFIHLLRETSIYTWKK
jgi:lipopolysaccharide biosynthesis protein